MTIVYLINYDISEENGVVQKIKQQSFQWRLRGHNVYLVSIKLLKVYDLDHNILFEEPPLLLNWGKLGTAIKLFYNTYKLSKLFQKIDFDLIYMRYMLYVPFLSSIFKKYKVVMEINSDDTLEYRLHSKITHYYNILTRNLTLKHIDSFITVSKELQKRFEFFNKPIMIIANGIDVKEYAMQQNNNDKPILVFIGTPNKPWHGLDKIVEMAKYFEKYQFYVIGTEGKETDNIKYFGYLSRAESTKVIQSCDVGIGTLSLYKTGLNEASPLKTRQYLACGLPIIYSYQDTDLCGNMDFSLRLKNEEKNIDYNVIESFVETVFNNQKIKIRAREFAEEMLDYTKKEEERLRFFRKVLGE